MTMTIDTVSGGPYVGDGVATVFPYPFKIWAAYELRVTHTDVAGLETVLVQGAGVGRGYTRVTRVGGESGGTFSYTLNGVVTALPVGEELLPESIVPYTQPTDLRNSGEWLPEVHELAFDRLCRQVQQVHADEEELRALVDTILGSPGGTLVTGAGAAGTVPLWTGANEIGNSLLSQSGSTVTATGSLSVTVNATVGGTLGVSGLATFNNNISVTSVSPAIVMNESDAAANNRLWYFFASAESLNILAMNDAGSAGGSILEVQRTGIVIDSVTIGGTSAIVSGNLGVIGGVLAGTMGSSGSMSVGTTLDVPNAGLRLLDTNASHYLIVSPGSDLTANRTLTIATGDANRTLTLTADVTLGSGSSSGSNTGDVTLAGAPDYITIAGQVITRAPINLATHVTGTLDSANIDQSLSVATLTASGQILGDTLGLTAGSIIGGAVSIGAGLGVTGGITATTTIAATGNLSGANFSGTSSGTNTGDQTITLTGNVTGSGTGSFATTIAALAVTNAMLAGSIAASKLVGSDIATVGTVTAGVWNGTVVGLGYGGTAKNMTPVNGGIIWCDADSMEVSAAGSAGQMLRSAGAAAPVWSTPTWPNAATTTGAYLRADGTNFIQSTLILPNAATANQVVYATATDTHGGSANLTFNGSALTITGTLTISDDVDTTTILGRARIDSRVTDRAYFSHRDQTGSSSYAILQLATGQTNINAASGQSLFLQVAGTSVITAAAALVTIAQPVTCSSTLSVTSTATFAGAQYTTQSPRAVTIASGTAVAQSTDRNISLSGEGGILDTIDTLTGGTDGQIITLSGQTGYSITITNNAGGTGQFYCNGGVSIVTLTLTRWYTFRYNSALAAWVQI